MIFLAGESMVGCKLMNPTCALHFVADIRRITQFVKFYEIKKKCYDAILTQFRRMLRQ